MGIQTGFPIFLNVSRETIIPNKFIFSGHSSVDCLGLIFN